jgi:acyl-coenzyme A thioesterase PaaI-like protein
MRVGPARREAPGDRRLYLNPMMDITKLPFNEFIGLAHSENSASLLRLPEHLNYTNHLGTVHASALMALAEASSGEVLIRSLGDMQDSVIPVVRRFECKFRRPAQGSVHSKAALTDEAVAALRASLTAKGRATIEVTVDIYDASDTHIMSATAEWFVATRRQA